MPSIVRMVVLGFALAGVGGCRFVDHAPKGKSPLQPLTAAPDSVTLEIFSAPVSRDDSQWVALWSLVDEQAFSPDLRQKLAQNGLRAGVVGPNLPDALANLLKITDTRVSAEERSSIPTDPEPGITQLVLHPRAGKRHDLLIPHAYDQIALLQHVDGQVEGKTYHKPECRLALRVYPESDGRVRIDLTPELHHGEFKSRAIGSEGMLMWRQEQQRQIFSDLELVSTLSAGQMLLVTCRPDRPGSVGHYFFTQPHEDKPLQTLWVFRASRAGPDQVFYDGPTVNASELSNDTDE